MNEKKKKNGDYFAKIGEYFLLKKIFNILKVFWFHQFRIVLSIIFINSLADFSRLDSLDLSKSFNCKNTLRSSTKECIEF